MRSGDDDGGRRAREGRVGVKRVKTRLGYFGSSVGDAFGAMTTACATRERRAMMTGRRRSRGKVDEIAGNER